MGTAVDVGDAATSLEQSRADAAATAKAIDGGALTAPDVAPAPPLKIGRTPQIKRSAPLGPPDPRLTTPDAQQPADADSIPHGDLTPPPPPTPERAAAKPGVWDQTGSEVGNGIARFAAHLGSLVGTGYQGVAALTGSDAIKAGADWIKKAADEAADYWQPEDPSKSGLGAQIAGDVAGVVPALALGPAAIGVLPAEAANTAYDQSVKEGQDVKTAAMLAVLAAGSNALGMKIPLKSPNIWKRIGTSILGNEAISAATQTITKEILNSNGYKDAAAKIDLTDPRSILSTLAIAIGFGLHRQAGATPKEADKAATDGTKVGQPPAPDASATAPDAGSPPPGPSGDPDVTPPPPPFPPASTAPAPTLNGGAGAEPAGSGIPDVPSIEPAKDLRAQIKDMNDKNTPRVGVLVAKDSLTSLQGSKDANALGVNGVLNQARSQGRTIVLPQGELILKSAKIAKATQERLTSGEDPQSVIGSVTGAGDGKSPDQTVVVQGQTPTGAVATETGVAPDAAHIAVQKVIDQGKTPVVTTPEAAVARRIDEVSKERNTPVQLGMVSRPDGTQFAVHVEPGAPEGKTRVRMLDADGEPGASTIDVDSRNVKVATPSDTEPSVKSATNTGEAEQTPGPTPPKVEETPIVSAKVDGEQDVGTTEKSVQTPTEDTSLPSADRRKDVAARKRVADMNDEERKQALLTNNKSGIPNDRAYEDSDKKKVQVSVDLNSLKTVNDTEGHAAGDAMIKRTAEVLHEESKGNAYHLGGDEFAVQADSHDEAEDIMARAKARLREENIGVSHGTGETYEAADKAMAADKIRQEETGERAQRGEPRPNLRERVAPTKLKAKKIESALEALPKALETHEQQEQTSEGKKFPAPLAERQENASLFAKILKSAADAARGKANPAVIERAVKAAKAAERLAEKGKEETAKGQGTSHVRTTALVAEMHKAARGLLGAAREGDAEVVRPKEAELKAKQERTRVRLTKKPAELSKTEAKVDKVEVPVNEKYKGDIRGTKAPEPKQPAQVQRDAQRLMDRYIHADESDISSVRTEVEQFLHEHMSDMYTPDEIKDVLQLLHEQRIEQNPDAKPGPRRMSDTIEDEMTGLDTSDKGLKTLGLRKSSRHALSLAEQIKAKVFDNRMVTEWQRLANNLHSKDALSDFIGDVFKKGKVDSGEAVGAHELLNRIIEHTDTPVLKSLLQNLRAKVPDLPVHFVSKVINLRNGLPYGNIANGLFDQSMDSVQVRPQTGNLAGTTRTIVHELVHAATAYEVHNNPTGALATALEKARVVLENRLKAKYGDAAIDQHKAYFRGETTTRPDDYMRKLYGISNVDEMMAELHSNPEFVQEIADSEMFARSDEGPLNDTFLGGAKTLLYKMYNAIGRFLGIQDPKLLQHIAGLTDKTMEVQHQRTAPGKAYDFLNKPVHDFETELVTAMRSRFGANPLEISRALPSFMEMAKDPAPIPRESEIMRSFANDEEAREPTMVARLFRQAMNSGAVDAVRAVKMSLKTVPQIFRDARRDFGDRDDPQNPLNRMADVNAEKTKIIHDMSEISRPVAKAWMKLKDADNKAVGALLRDVTMYKLDPRKTLSEQTPEGKDDPKAAARHAEFETRYKGLTPESRAVFDGALDASRKLARAERRANIDTALEAFSDSPITDAQRTLLYGARRPEDFDSIVGDGKLIDVGDNNDKLIESLKDFAGQSELNGPYAHLGRHGDYVVTAEPEGSRRFADEASARRFAKEVGDLSPNSKGTYVYRGGEHQVDYKVQYTSFHDTRNEAEAELQRMRDAGYKVGAVTRKTMSREDTPLSAGTRDLVAAAESKINRNGKSVGNDALVAGLRSAFLQLAAQRSAYAGSRMARKNFAGVKPEEMRRNFADHAQSTIWHTAQLRTTFKQASALAKLRDLARNPEGVDQQTAYRRGEVVDALNKHLKDEVANFGHKSPLNAGLARLGFMSYLASPSHALIWMTQNFTTGIPVAGARWGYGRASSSFGSAMKLLTSPALRETVHAIFGKGGGADEVNKAIIDSVKKDARFGKWAQGPNSHLQQLIDRGVLGHSYSNELHEMAQSGKPVLGIPATDVNKAFEWARLLPNMADSWNRVSTALAVLEMTGGDIRKTADFVDEVHADYSAEAKPLAFKKIGRVPGANSITMFKTYTQSMIHLFYGNLKAAMVGSAEIVGGKSTPESRRAAAEAAKTAAGMVLANSLFAGVYGAAAIEPLRLALYAYHKLFDKEGEVYDLKNSIHRFLVDYLGKSAGDVAAGGLPHLAGFDLSSRMGLADLFFHEPPDLFSADKDAWKNFAYNEAGPMVSFLAERTSQFVGHMQKGEAFQAMSSLIPIKMYQDAVKAAQLATTGKTNSLGGQMTKPSALDAAYQLFGLKPSSVAGAQEKSTTKVNYNAEVKATRDSILKAFVSAAPGPDRATAQKRINAFNKLHPAEAIKPTDQIKMMKYRQETQSNAPGRDTTLNKMLNY